MAWYHVGARPEEFPKRSPWARIQAVAVPVALLVASLGVPNGASQPRANTQVGHTRTQTPGGTPPAQPVAPWETFSKDTDTYAHRGIARVEHAGARWVLTIFCDGTHSVYIDTATKADLQAYATGFVRARYIYVDRLMKDPRCFKEACNAVVERRVILEHVQRVDATDDKARQLVRQCGGSKRDSR